MSAKNRLSKAMALMQQGAYDAALKEAKAIKPFHPEYALAQGLIADAHYNTGVMMLRLQSWQVAEECFLAALDAAPQHDEALNNLGSLALMNKDYHKAIAFYERALQANPQRYRTWLDMAHCYDNTGQMAALHERIYPAMRSHFPRDGASAMRQALSTEPVMRSPESIQSNRARALQYLEAVIASPLAIDHPAVSNTSYFYYTYHGENNKTLNQKVAQAYLACAPSLAWSSPHVERWSRLDLATRRIKVGIVSAYLYNHRIGSTFANLARYLDAEKFEVHIIHLGVPPKDAVSQSLPRSLAQSQGSVHILNSEDLGALRRSVAALELDLLFYPDIGMSPWSYFLAFARLAPVQITSFGHPDTTGIPNMDYYISAQGYEPDNAQAHYSETLITLPHAFMMSDYELPVPASSKQRQDFGLTQADCVFICPQTLFKIHPDMLAYWQACVAGLPQAKLVLIAPVQQAWREQFDAVVAHRAPELKNHILWLPRQSRYEDYLALLGCADVLLDNLHFNGYNTNLDAFSVNLPVVTQATGLQRGRVSAAMLRALGLDELIAQDCTSYAAIAQRLATDKDYQARLRAHIAQHKHLLYQRKDIVPLYEQAFIEALGRA